MYFVKKDINIAKLNLPKNEVAAVQYMPYDKFILEFMKDKNNFIPYPKEYKEAVKQGLDKVVNN